MSYLLRCGLIVAAFLLVASSTSWGQRTPEASATLADAVRLRKLTMGIVMYTSENGDQLPADLMAITPYLTGDLAATPADKRAAAVREAFLTGRDQDVKIPDEVNAAWLAEHSSYSYLPGAGLKIGDLAGWDRLAVAHLKLDKGLAAEPSPLNPEGELFSVAFMDSHVELMPRAEAEAVIAESAAIYEAIKTGKPLPEAFQAVMNLRAVMDAIRAYAKAHGDELPPNLGATLEFVPADPKRRPKPADRARVFLSPAAAGTHVPDEPTAEWVNERTSWVYLGCEGVKLGELEDPANTILLHGKFDAPMEHRVRTGARQGIPVAAIHRDPRVESEVFARWIAGVSKRIVAWAKTGSPLPDHVNAFRDVRLLLRASNDYAKNHNSMLPSDLGELLPYVLPDAGPEERAKVFLSPAKERLWDDSLQLTPEWVRATSSYVYLPPGSVDLKLVRELGVHILIHGPLNEPYEVMMSESPMRVVAAGMAFNYTWMTPVEAIQRAIDESRSELKNLFDAMQQSK